MFNIQSSLLGTGWYDTCASPTIEYAKGGEDLKEAFSISGAGSFYLVKPDKSWEGATLSHYGHAVAFEDVFDEANIPIDMVGMQEHKTPNLKSAKLNKITKAKGKISFISPSEGFFSLSIFSLAGQKIKKFPLNVSTKGVKIDLISTKELSSGSYLFTVHNKQNTFTSKIIINH